MDRFWHQGMIYRMIPMMKTCVALDPNFVDAYLLGAWHLSYNATAKMDETPQALKTWDAKHQTCVGDKERYFYMSVDFLQDGIRKNPHNYRIYFDLGFMIYKQKLKDYANAVKYLSLAIQQYHDVWVPRQLCICLELNGQYAEAQSGWEQYQKDNPGLVSAQETAPRFIKRIKALRNEQEMDKANKAAMAATSQQEVDDLKKQAVEYKKKAMQLWTELNEPFGAYRIARSGGRGSGRGKTLPGSGWRARESAMGIPG